MPRRSVKTAQLVPNQTIEIGEKPQTPDQFRIRVQSCLGMQAQSPALVETTSAALVSCFLGHCCSHPVHQQQFAAWAPLLEVACGWTTPPYGSRGFYDHRHPGRLTWVSENHRLVEENNLPGGHCQGPSLLECTLHFLIGCVWRPRMPRHATWDWHICTHSGG